MNRATATLRTTAAIQRLGAASPVGILAYTAVHIAAETARCAAHICIGFGLASLADISAWWGLPFALASGQTLGRVWAWWRRDSQVVTLEAMADQAEKDAATKGGAK